MLIGVCTVVCGAPGCALLSEKPERAATAAHASSRGCPLESTCTAALAGSHRYELCTYVTLADGQELWKVGVKVPAGRPQ